VLATLIDDGEISGGGGGDVAYGVGTDDTGVGEFDLIFCFAGIGDAIEVDLNGTSGLLGVGSEGKSFDDEEVGRGGEEDGPDATFGGAHERAFDEGATGGEVGERGEGGERATDAEEEVAVAELPEVLAVIVESPGGLGEDASGGKFEEESVDVAILIGFGIVGQTGEKTADGEGEEEMAIVDVVEGKERTALQEELVGDGLEAEGFERNTKWRVGPFGEQGGGGEKKEKGEREETAEETAGARVRDWEWGNRHG
jgi:hypothetical protein